MRQGKTNNGLEKEALGRTIVPDRIGATIQINIFFGDCPTVGDRCKILSGEGKGEWYISKVGIHDDYLEVTMVDHYIKHEKEGKK